MNYLIIANTYLILFYIFYCVFLSRETFFQWNRIYLIGSTALSFVLPLVQLKVLQDLFTTSTVMVARTSLDAVTIYANPAQAEAVESGMYSIPIWMYVYLLGIIISILFFIKRAVLLRKQLGVTGAGDAYSFMHIIHVDKEQEGSSEILNHERVHVKQYHTVDVLFFELVRVLNWFNPIVYSLSKSIKLTHEYIADEAVNKSNEEKIAYAELLISRTFSVSSKFLANNFSGHSFLKRRIKMLFKDKSKRLVLFKYVFIIPLFLSMLIFSSAKVSRVEQLGGALSFNAVGNNEFYKLVGRNVSYMQAAKKKGAQGTVDLAFEKRGEELIQTKVLNTIGYKQGEEVERVLHLSEVKSEMPEGKHILRIKFTLAGLEEGAAFEEKTIPLTKLSGYSNLDEVVIVGYLLNKKAKDKKGDANLPSVQAGAEQDTTREVMDFNKVEKQPQFPGGMQAFYKWVGENYKYPAEAKKNKVSGSLHLSFVVERDGSLSNFELLRDLGYGTGEAAIDLLKESPKWKPGLTRGETVRVSYSLPIKLNLQGLKDSVETKSMP